MELENTITSATRTVAVERSSFQASSWICFAGSGTVGKVAAQLKRNYILIELNPKYVGMIKQRVTEGETGIPVKEQDAGQMALKFEGKAK